MTNSTGAPFAYLFANSYRPFRCFWCLPVARETFALFFGADSRLRCLASFAEFEIESNSIASPLCKEKESLKALKNWKVLQQSHRCWGSHWWQKIPNAKHVVPNTEWFFPSILVRWLRHSIWYPCFSLLLSNFQFSPFRSIKTKTFPSSKHFPH